jgi:oligosaccharide translocation protein RFT1
LKTTAEYTVVSNLGSLIPRHIYAPVEEVCYNLFAKMDQEKKKSKFSDNEINILENSFRMIHLLGFFLVIFGYLYSPVILNALYGEKYSTTVNFSSLIVIM